MNTLLVPIDFSESSDNALNYAIELANFLEGNIILLHIDSVRLYNFDSTILTNTIDDVLEKPALKKKVN